MKVILATISFLIFITGGYIAHADWQVDPKRNTPVCVAEGDQELPDIVEDGQGGVIVVWHDSRDGNRDVYAQHINADGKIQWAENGVPVNVMDFDQGQPVAVSDGGGGAIIAWTDSRDGSQSVYAQRINADGKLLWDVGGVAVCVNDFLKEDVVAMSDGANGAIFAWEDLRNGNGNHDFYAQRIDKNGKPMWTNNGEPVCGAVGDQFDPSLTTDGTGGAIFVWWDIGTPDWNIGAQKLNSQGKPVWGAEGIMVCDVKGIQGNPLLINDGANGAIVVWVDYRDDEMSFVEGDIYAQRLDAKGTHLWAKGGIAICKLPSNQQQPVGISDSAGGIILAWRDERDVYADIYAQRVNKDGKTLWQEDGVPICVAGGMQSEPKSISDSASGAVIFWKDFRKDYDDKSADEIFAQRINNIGKFLWQKDGVAVCTAGGQQLCPRAASDGKGGAFIVWSDFRNKEGDIYIQPCGFPKKVKSKE